MGKNFYLLLTAYFISNVGSWIFRFALPLLIFEMTSSSFMMSVAYALTFLPYLIILPLGGVIADRCSHKKILLYGDIASAIISCLLFFSAWMQMPLAIILNLIFLLSSMTAIHHPAFQSVIPSLVSKNNLSKANSWIQTSDNIIALSGPMLGATIVVTLGNTQSIFLDAFSYVFSAIIIFAIRIQSISTSHQKINRSVWQDLREGLNYALINPIIKYGTILFIFVNFSSNLIMGNILYHLSESLQISTHNIGVFFSIAGLAAIFGSLLAPFLGRIFANGRLMLLCIVLDAVGISLLFSAKTLMALTIARSISTLSEAIIVVTMSTLRQRVVPQQILGRTVAVTRTTSYISIPLASMLGGFLLQHDFHFELLVIVSAGVLIATAVAGLFTPFAYDKNTLLKLESQTL